MPRNFDRSWFVFESIENSEHDRCVDIFERPDGTFGFDEFRKDVEDGGAWTPVSHYSGLVYRSRDDALVAATRAVKWLRTERG